MALVPVDGGGGNVNGDFRIIRQTPSIITEPDGTVKDAVTVTARELAFGVDYTFTMPTDTWQGGTFVTYARVLASYIQEIASKPEVVDIYSTQDTNRRGLLNDYLFITVGIPGTDSEATVRVLQDQSNSLATFQAINDTYNTLATNQNAS